MYKISIILATDSRENIHKQVYKNLKSNLMLTDPFQDEIQENISVGGTFESKI